MQNGQFVEAMKVGFVTAAGVSGDVTVPLATYSKQTVAEAIAKRATVLDEVQNLSAGSMPISPSPPA